MVDYRNSRCFKCKKPFKEGDDIVICPECGTPYHRACYLEEGKCINTELHEKHETYHEETEKAKDTATSIVCPVCHTENPPLSLFCSKCGMPLSPTTPNDKADAEKNKDFKFENYGNTFGQQAFKINFSDPLCGLDPEEEFDGVTAKEIADYIGPNVYYYLPMFKRFKETGHKFSINFSGMLIPACYYSFRKMHLFAILSIIIQALISVPAYIMLIQSYKLSGSLITDFANSFDVKGNSFVLLYNLCGFLSYALMFLSGSFANYLYYRHTVSRIKVLRSKNMANRKNIRHAGGTSKVNVLIYCGAIFFMSMIVGALTILF